MLEKYFSKKEIFSSCFQHW